MLVSRSLSQPQGAGGNPGDGWNMPSQSKFFSLQFQLQEALSVQFYTQQVLYMFFTSSLQVLLSEVH